MNPRIMFCSQAAYTGGGMEAWMESLADCLEDRGWDVIIALAKGKIFHNPKQYLKIHRHAQTAVLDGTMGYRECRVDALLNCFNHLQPDVIIPVGLADALYAAALWKKQGAAVKLVTCLHGQSIYSLNDMKTCVSYIDLAASVSRKGKIMVEQEIPGLVGRTVHTPTGVPAPVVRIDKRDNTVLNLVYVGRLDHQEKRVLDLVSLAQRIKDKPVRLHIVGSGPDDEKLRQGLGGMAASGEAIFYGQLDRAKLYTDIYPFMDAILIFSPAEGGPIVAWEAMAHGVIPVVSDFRGRKEEKVLQHQQNCLVFPVGDMSKAMHCISLLLDPQERLRLSKQAVILPSKYSLDEFSVNWDRLLRKCLSVKNSREYSDLPKMVSPGRLANFGLGYKGASLLRKFCGRTYVHNDPGGEWPANYSS